MRCAIGKKSAINRGFTLVEAVVSLMIVSTLFAAAMQAAATSTQVQATAAKQSLAASLASSLLTEILELNYTQSGSTTLGRETGETLATKINYNDVDDYDGWTESPPQDRSGIALPGTTGYTRSVAVVWVTPANVSVTSSTSTGLKRITVTVTYGGVTTQMTGYRANID